MQTVYVETTIASYLGAHPSRLEPMASHQQLTHEWWNQHKYRFLLYSSAFVRGEAAGGDPDAAQRRLIYLTPLPELDVPDELDQLEAELIRLFQLPPRAATDASHLGMAMLKWTIFSHGTANTSPTRPCKKTSMSIACITSSTSPSSAPPKPSSNSNHE